MVKLVFGLQLPNSICWFESSTTHQPIANGGWGKMQGSYLPWKPAGTQTDRNCDTTESDVG